MYIPEFWCGVAATIVAEFAAFVVAYMVSERKKKKK